MNKSLKKNDVIIYIGGKHSILEKDKEYKVYTPLEKGVRVYIDTGFAGIKDEDFIVA